MNALVEVLSQAWRAEARRLGWALVHFRRQGTLLPGPSSRRTASLVVLTALVAGVALYGCTADSMPQASESQPVSTTHPATRPAPSVHAKPLQAEVERPAAESTKRTTLVLPSELNRRRVNPPWTAEEKTRLEALIFTALTFGDPNTWGESANGLQARLSVKSTSQQPRASAVLVFHLRNTGDKPIRILKLSAQARFWGECLPLEILRFGAILKYQGPLLTPPPPPNESEYITLNPGDVDSIEVTFVPEHWKLAVPFEAQAVFVFKQTLQEDKTVGPYDPDKRQWRTVSGLWTGEARAQAVTVKMGTAATTTAPASQPTASHPVSAKAASR